MTKEDGVRVTYGEDSIAIEEDRPDGQEIVYWDIEEWVFDPDVVFSIVNAVELGLTRGADALAEMLYGG